MPSKKPLTHKDRFHSRVINLTFLFFMLCVVLSVVAIFRFRSYYYPTSALTEGEYVVFEKNARSMACEKDKPCRELIKVYNNGRVLALGSKMINSTLDTAKYAELLYAINKSGILYSDCRSNDTVTYEAEYIIKLGLQVKRINYPGCLNQISELERIILN